MLTDDSPAALQRRAYTGPILQVRNLSVEYATDLGEVLAVDDVSFDMSPGEFIGVVGESGCGKSTLLFAISQLLVPPASVSARQRHVPRAQPGRPDRPAAGRGALEELCRWSCRAR